MWFGPTLLGTFVRLSKHGLERLGDVGIVTRADLDPRRLELRSELLALCLGDLPLYMQVALLADNNAGDRLGACVVEDLVVDSLDHVEAIAGSDAVDEHVTVDADGVFRVEDRILVLACCVDDIAVVFLPFVGDGLLKDVLDGRVVRIDKGVLDVSDD